MNSRLDSGAASGFLARVFQIPEIADQFLLVGNDVGLPQQAEQHGGEKH